MKNGASAGFEAYEYPRWSQVVGWLIFVGCIIPIPLVYLVNYIKEFQKIGLRQLVRITIFLIICFVLIWSFILIGKTNR